MTAPVSGRGGGLPPLGRELNRDCREFAESLRSLFQDLGVSARRYASRCYLGPDTLSHYLAGSRVPSWEFVEELLRNLADDRGVRIDPPALDRLRDQHGAARRTSSSIGRAVQELEGQLHAADRETRRARAREEQLAHALDDVRRSVAALEARMDEPEEPAGPTDPADPAGRSPLLAEHETLSLEITRLTDELEQIRRHTTLAEARCELLERQLTLVERQQGTVPPPPPTVVRQLVPGPPPKVLMVDDRRENLLVLEAVLGTEGHQLVGATSGPDALRALLDSDDYAVILLDVQMPGMDGYETAAHIKRRARTRDIPIVFVTALGGDPDHSMRGYAAGAVDFIAKPVDPWALRAKVAVFVDLHRERRGRA